MDIQHIYLNMDDSGKISRFEDCSIFAGIVFTNSDEKSSFVNKYKSIIKNIKCNYCENNNSNCNNDCPEIKGINISNTNRRQLMNLSKKYITFASITYNKNLNSNIINDVGSKGRFCEYAQRRIIKQTIKHLINAKIIDPNKPIYLHVNIDEMPTKSNGYYSLKDGLIEELKYGIRNYNYGITFKPIVNSSLEVQVLYKDSKYDSSIQMADIIANTVRRQFVFNNSWVEFYDYLSNKLNIDVILRLPN